MNNTKIMENESIYIIINKICPFSKHKIIKIIYILLKKKKKEGKVRITYHHQVTNSDNSDPKNCNLNNNHI